MSKKPKSVREQISEFVDNEWCFLPPTKREELAKSLTRLFWRMLRKRKNAK